MSTRTAPESSRRWQPLTGGTAVWVFMSVEVITFGMFLLGHAWGWRTTPESHAAGQALLDVESAVVSTFLLLLGSGFAYHAVLAEEDDRPQRTVAMLFAAAACGVAFSIHKIMEYQAPALANVSLSTSSFWFSYLFLTGLHLFHVIGGVGLFGWVGVQTLRSPDHPNAEPSVASVATYWHMVDVIWVLLFPILYLMHP